MSPLKRALSITHFIANKIVKVTFAIAIHFIFPHLTFYCAYVAIICRFVAFVNILFATMLHFSIELIFSLCYDEPRTKGGVPMNERIKALRKELNLTQQEFADRLNIKRGAVANYEIGRNEPIDAVISLICKTFNVNEEWLRDGNGEMFIERSPEEEVGYYVEDLLEYDGNGNAFYDAIIEMMKTYHSLDDKSKTVIREYFKNVADGIKNKEEKA